MRRRRHWIIEWLADGLGSPDASWLLICQLPRYGVGSGTLANQLTRCVGPTGSRLRVGFQVTVNRAPHARWIGGDVTGDTPTDGRRVPWCVNGAHTGQRDPVSGGCFLSATGDGPGRVGLATLVRNSVRRHKCARRARARVRRDP
jgi:hypothetical protein